MEPISDAPADVLSQPLKERGPCTGCDESHTHSARKRRCTRQPASGDNSVVKAVVEASHARGVAEGVARARMGRRWGFVTRTLLRIAKRHCVTLRTLYSWEARALSGTLARRAGSGRPRKTTKAVDDWFRATTSEQRGTWTIRGMTTRMKVKFGFGSHQTTVFLARRLGFHRVALGTLPILNEKHKAARVAWCTDYSARPQPFGDENSLFIHVDEKWFYGLRMGRRIWVAQGAARPRVPVQSKQFINKVMFLAAVGKPIFNKFDGAIGLYPLANIVPATRASSRRPAGAPVLKSFNMDKDTFVKMLKENVVRDALKKCPWAHEITIQMDNAGGHGGGGGSKIEDTLSKLNTWANQLPRDYLDLLDDSEHPPKIIFIAQPACSPDLNVLDLGAWRSMDIAVDKVKRNATQRQLDGMEIYNAARDAWASWQSAEKLTKLFDTLQSIWKCIVDIEGRNDYLLPHQN